MDSSKYKVGPSPFYKFTMKRVNNKLCSSYKAEVLTVLLHPTLQPHLPPVPQLSSAPPLHVNAELLHLLCSQIKQAGK